MKIEIINVEWTPGKNLIRDPKVLKEFEEFVALKYIENVRRYVDKQMKRWIPLSVRYLEYKKEKGLSLKTWEATGELLKGLKFDKRHRAVTFDKRRRHKVSGLPYMTIARSNEYGDLTHPPRPLFRPIYLLMRKNIGRYYKEFLKERSGAVK